MKWWEEDEERWRRGVQNILVTMWPITVCCCVLAPEVWMMRDQFLLAYSKMPTDM